MVKFWLAYILVIRRSFFRTWIGGHSIFGLFSFWKVWESRPWSIMIRVNRLNLAIKIDLDGVYSFSHFLTVDLEPPFGWTSSAFRVRSLLYKGQGRSGSGLTENSLEIDRGFFCWRVKVLTGSWSAVKTKVTRADLSRSFTWINTEA